MCVQGCTLEEGVDYDQTFAKPLRHASARGLFAYAARNKCAVRSVDFVAAYLQGDFLEGEVVYCLQPAGSNVMGSDGRPKVCVIRKPIYGVFRRPADGFNEIYFRGASIPWGFAN